MSSYRAVRITKQFTGVTVLDGVDFEIRSGEVHALLGENGSGKSTLVRILGGVHPPTAGYLECDGEPVRLSSPAQAQREGVAIVHQDLNLFRDLDIATNIAVGAGAPSRFGIVDRPGARRRAREALARLGVHFDPRQPLRELGPAEWKLVEVARALLSDVAFLFLDEPTALLDRRDSQTLLTTIERLRSEGLGIALVTHRLEEALRVADRLTVLRDGRKVATLDRDDTTVSDLVRHIVGSEADVRRGGPNRRRRTPVGTVLKLRGLRTGEGKQPFDLDVRAGEILGMTGLLGAGALETARMIGGRAPLHGTAFVDGQPVAMGSPHAAVRAGIGYVPEDRREAGLFGGLSVQLNVCMAALSQLTARGFVQRGRMQATARRYAGEVGIRGASLDAPVATLSGGNQQKVQIAKWLSSGQRILVIESPTHGVDIGAKAQIQRLLHDFAAGGGAVIVASTDIPDVLAVADRVAVFAEGELVETVHGSRSSHREVLLSGVADAKVERIEELMAR